MELLEASRFLKAKANEAIPGIRVEVVTSGMSSSERGGKSITLSLENWGGTYERPLVRLSHELGHSLQAPVGGFSEMNKPTAALWSFKDELDATMKGEQFAIKWRVFLKYQEVLGEHLSIMIARLSPKSFALLPTSLSPDQALFLVRYLDIPRIVQTVAKFPQLKAVRDRGVERVRYLLEKLEVKDRRW